MTWLFKHRFLILRRFTQALMIVLYFGAHALGWKILEGNLSSSLVFKNSIGLFCFACSLSLESATDCTDLTDLFCLASLRSASPRVRFIPISQHPSPNLT